MFEDPMLTYQKEMIETLHRMEQKVNETHFVARIVFVLGFVIFLVDGLKALHIIGT